MADQKELSRSFKQPARDDPEGNARERSTLQVAFTGSFCEEFELKAFPVDFQKLHMYLVATDECYLRRQETQLTLTLTLT